MTQRSGTAQPSMVAALYVEKGGVYYGLPGVDPWDEERDARKYAGPWPRRRSCDRSSGWPDSIGTTKG